MIIGRPALNRYMNWHEICQNTGPGFKFLTFQGVWHHGCPLAFLQCFGVLPGILADSVAVSSAHFLQALIAVQVVPGLVEQVMTHWQQDAPPFRSLLSMPPFKPFEQFFAAVCVMKYNNYRPHKALDGLTPMAYVQATCSGA